jgi:hypothetical protein
MATDIGRQLEKNTLHDGEYGLNIKAFLALFWSMFCLISSSSILKPITHTIIFYVDIIFVKGYILKQV